MPRRTARTKEELVDEIIARQKAVIDQKILEPVLIDLLVPLAGAEGKIKAIDEEGNVTIEFKSPILSHLNYLTKKKLEALLDMMEELAPAKNK
ncbi:MAG: hypothetical protein GYA24_12845, partial [Candidatus Lokiarchaeota archaeon]|nr:hypothetical protein [Candidatus Lokiarchaeota archaeon]